MNDAIVRLVNNVIKLSACVITLIFTTSAIADEFQLSYPVTGSTAQELIEQMNSNEHVPKGAFGYTKLETQIGWVSFINSDGLCEIDSVDFDYDITIYMPEWLEKHTAKQCLQDSWDEVWVNIQLHEEKHRDLFLLLNKPLIAEQLASIEPQASCAILKTAINTELESILSKNEFLHDQFHAANTPPTLWDC